MMQIVVMTMMMMMMMMTDDDDDEDDEDNENDEDDEDGDDAGAPSCGCRLICPVPERMGPSAEDIRQPRPCCRRRPGDWCGILLSPAWSNLH